MGGSSSGNRVGVVSLTISAHDNFLVPVVGEEEATLLLMEVSTLLPAVSWGAVDESVSSTFLCSLLPTSLLFRLKLYVGYLLLPLIALISLLGI